MTENRKILELLMSGEVYAIDFNFAFSQLTQYIHELNLLERGVPFQNLSFSKRREEEKPKIIISTQSNFHEITLTSSIKTFSSGNGRTKNFAMFKVNGTMRQEGGLCSYGISDLAEQIYEASQNPNIQGIIMRMNSGGGESIAGQTLRNALSDSRKPIIALVDLAASAALDGILTVNEIIASGAQSRIGSVGSFVSINKKLVEDFKANVQTVYASQSTNKNADIRTYIENGDTSILEKVVSENAQIFIDAVHQHRPKTKKHEDTTNGSMFFAKEGKEKGLFDSIGTLQHAVNRLHYLTD